MLCTKCIFYVLQNVSYDKHNATWCHHFIVRTDLVMFNIGNLNPEHHLMSDFIVTLEKKLSDAGQRSTSQCLSSSEFSVGGWDCYHGLASTKSRSKFHWRHNHDLEIIQTGPITQKTYWNLLEVALYFGNCCRISRFLCFQFVATWSFGDNRFKNFFVKLFVFSN